MPHTVEVHLEQFGMDAVRRLTGEGRRSPDEAFQTAALYYLRSREPGRSAWRAPAFGETPEDAERLRVTFDDDIWAALNTEAREQQVQPEKLAVHALMYFVADVDRGRVGERLARELSESDEVPRGK